MVNMWKVRAIVLIAAVLLPAHNVPARDLYFSDLEDRVEGPVLDGFHDVQVGRFQTERLISSSSSAGIVTWNGTKALSVQATADRGSEGVRVRLFPMAPPSEAHPVSFEMDFETRLLGAVGADRWWIDVWDADGKAKAASIAFRDKGTVLVWGGGADGALAAAGRCPFAVNDRPMHVALTLDFKSKTYDVTLTQLKNPDNAWALVGVSFCAPEFKEFGHVCLQPNWANWHDGTRGVRNYYDNMRIAAVPELPGKVRELRLPKGNVTERKVFRRGETIPVEISALRADRIEFRVEHGGDAVLVYQGACPLLKVALTTAHLLPGQYRLVASAGIDRREKTIEIVPRRPPMYPFGVYGYASSSKSPPEHHWRALRDLAANGTTVVGGYSNWMPRATLDALLEEVLRLGMTYVTKISLYFNWGGGEERAVCADGAHPKAYGKEIWCLGNPRTRAVARDGVKAQLELVRHHPAFSGRAYFGDDVLMFTHGGSLSCYCDVCREGFKKLTGLEPPKRTAEELAKVRGIIPDDDPWLRWMRYRCEQVMAGYQRAIIEGKNELAPEVLMGPMHGRIWQINYGFTPESELSVTDLASFYHYPYAGWHRDRHPSEQLFYCELARLGGRQKEVWVTPQAFDDTGRPYGVSAAYVRNQAWYLLAGAARGITYFTFSMEAPQCLGGNREALAAYRRMAALCRRIGPLLSRWERQPSRVALLVSFATNAYDVMEPHDETDRHLIRAQHAYLTLLRAGIHPEVVTEDAIRRGELSRYGVLLLVDCRVLSRSAAEGIAAFARAGGHVLVDDLSSVAIEGAREIGGNLSAGYAPRKEDRAAIAGATELARRLDLLKLSGDEPMGLSGSDEVIAVPMHCVASRPPTGRQPGHLVLINTDLNNQRTVKVARPDGYLYDLNKSRMLSARGEAASITLAPGDGAILAICPESIASVGAILPSAAVRGERFSLRVELNDSKGKALAAPCVVNLDVFRSDGSRHDVSGSYLVRGGRMELEVPVGRNAPCGTWAAVVTEQGSGQAGVGHVTVQPAVTAQARIASAGQREGRAAVDLAVVVESVDPGRTTDVEVDAPKGIDVGPAWRLSIKGSGAVTFSLERDPARRPQRYAVAVRATRGPWVVNEEKVEVIFDAATARPVAVPRAAGPVMVDGDLGDWNGSAAMRLDSAGHVVKWKKPWQGPEDLSATGYLMWDDNHLYFAAEVTDDVFVQTHTDGSLWANDCIQLGFSALVDRQPGGGLGERDREFGLALGPEGPIAFQFYPAGERDAKLKVAAKRIEGGVVYEAAFPWSSLQAVPHAGETFLFVWTVNESDDEINHKFEGWMAWCDGLVGGKDPSRWGLISLR